MSRPTLNEIEDGAEYDSGQYQGISMFREELEKHGYVIIHPDDFPTGGRALERYWAPPPKPWLQPGHQRHLRRGARMNDLDLHAEFQQTDECKTHAWDELSFRQPDLLPNDLIGWFMDTERYDTVFNDWRDADPERRRPTPTALDLLADLETQGFEWQMDSDNGEVLATFWRGTKRECRADQVLPIKFYGPTVEATLTKAHATLSDPNFAA